MTIRARLAIATLTAALVTGCAAGDDAGPRGWVSGAARAHELADEAVARGDLNEARRTLRAAVDAPIPEAVEPEDRRVVRQDLLYRLADVELRASRAAEAESLADEGLGLGRARDLFTANLLVMRGRAREALSKDREAAGDYFEALEINSELLDRALEGGSTGEEGR